jgi:hypothetical protein
MNLLQSLLLSRLPALVVLRLMTGGLPYHDRPTASNHVIEPTIFLEHSALLFVYVDFNDPSKLKEPKSETTGSGDGVNRREECYGAFRSYFTEGPTHSGRTVQILRKCSVLWLYCHLGKPDIWRSLSDLKGGTPLRGGVIQRHETASETEYEPRRETRWSNVVLFDGVMVDIPKARAVLAKLGLLDNPEFVAERGVPLPDGFWEGLDEQ